MVSLGLLLVVFFAGRSRSSRKEKGNLSLTGNLGDVMKESASAALSYARAHYADFGIKKDFL